MSQHDSQHRPGRGAGLAVSSTVWVPQAALRFSFSRSSGPGGQAVNKLSTKAELRVSVRDIKGMDDFAAARLRNLAGRRLTQDDEIIMQAETSRSQLDNKQEALERLRLLIIEALKRPKIRRKKKPTRRMIEKRLESKRRSSQKKGQRRRMRGGEMD